MEQLAIKNLGVIIKLPKIVQKLLDKEENKEL